MIYTKKNDDTNVIVSQVLTNEESSYINSLSAIPIIIDNDRYVVDNTYINRVSEDYDISREESISLLENTNNIDNLTIAISDIDSIIDPTLLTESSNFIIYPQSELTEEYDYYEDILQAVFDEDNESLLEYLDIEDDLDILNERQISKEDLKSQFYNNVQNISRAGNLKASSNNISSLNRNYSRLIKRFPDLGKILFNDKGEVNNIALNKLVKRIKSEDTSRGFDSQRYEVNRRARNRLRSIYGKNIIDSRNNLNNDLTRPQVREIRKIHNRYVFDAMDDKMLDISKSAKLDNRADANLKFKGNFKSSKIPEKYQNASNTSHDVTDRAIDALMDTLTSSQKRELLALHASQKHLKKTQKKMQGISNRLERIEKEEAKNVPADQDQNITVKINGKKRLIRQNKGETVSQAKQRYIEIENDLKRAEESKRKSVSTSPSPTSDKKEEPKREVVTVQKQGEKTKSDSPRDGETVKDTAKRLSTQNQPLQLEYKPTVNKNAFIKQSNNIQQQSTSSETEVKKTETKAKNNENVNDTPKRVLKSGPLQLEYHPNDKKQQQEEPPTKEKRVFNTKKTVKTDDVIPLGYDKPKTEDRPNRVIPSSDKKTEEPPKPKAQSPSSTNNNSNSSSATVPPAVKQDLNKDKTNISRIAKIGGGLAAAGGAYAAARKIASLKNLQNKWARKLLLLPPAKRGIVHRILDKIKRTIQKLSSRR